MSLYPAPLALAALAGASGAEARPEAPDAGSRLASRAVGPPVRELRDALPAPLRFGELKPELGAWVEYQASGKAGSRKVRIAHVADVTLEGTSVHQLEVDFGPGAPLLVVWITVSVPRSAQRMALAAPPAPPVSVPLDLPLSSPEVRGATVERREAGSLASPFAGKSVRLEQRDGEAPLATVIVSDQVPLLGVFSVRWAGESWVATGAGKGAQQAFRSVPILVPRVKAE